MNKPEVLALMDNPCQQFSIVKAYCLCVSVINCRNYATAQQQCDNIVVEPQKKKTTTMIAYHSIQTSCLIVWSYAALSPLTCTETSLFQHVRDLLIWM